MYPELVLYKDRIRANVRAVVGQCKAAGIQVTGVVKGVNGNLDIVKMQLEEGVTQIGSSRLHQLEAIKNQFPKARTMLLRIPMLSEIERMVETCDLSLQSELAVLRRANAVSMKKGIRHQVVLMYDVGDLREGFFKVSELLEAALEVEFKLSSLVLAGIGINIGCYGSVKATPEIMHKLVDAAARIEEKIGRKLEIVSGGATSSLPLVVKGEMPEGINHLRIGEGMLTAREVDEFYHAPIKGQYKNALILRAELVEIKEKPTHPIGTLAYDAFGNQPAYDDRGLKVRLILAVGRQDIGSHDRLIPVDPEIELIGSSSDHVIVETKEWRNQYKLGDILEFELLYPAMLYLTESPDVRKTMVGGGL